MENQQNKALLAFRAQIDQIDDKIISLLKQRMEVIAEVRDLKEKNNEKFFIKSSREADMIKNLAQKAGVDFPKSSIVNIWRKIITAANTCEQALAIAIHNPKNISAFEYLVKEYYSEEVPFHNFDSATNIILAMEKGEFQIGVFALPQNDQDLQENWWISLANNRLGLKVFAKIPFVEFLSEEKNSDVIKLVAVAAKEPEKSSADNSLLYVEVGKEISKTQILAALEEQNFEAKILKSVSLKQVEGVVFCLVEISGFWLEGDEAVQNFMKSKIKPYVRIIGHYAKPLLIDAQH